MKQIKFYDIEQDVDLGGILLDNGDVVCGCCGGVYSAEKKDIEFRIEKIYDYWVDLSDAICGDD